MCQFCYMKFFSYITLTTNFFILIWSKNEYRLVRQISHCNWIHNKKKNQKMWKSIKQTRHHHHSTVSSIFCTIPTLSALWTGDKVDNYEVFRIFQYLSKGEYNGGGGGGVVVMCGKMCGASARFYWNDVWFQPG